LLACFTGRLAEVALAGCPLDDRGASRKHVATFRGALGGTVCSS
jgi:hypothetical protein